MSGNFSEATWLVDQAVCSAEYLIEVSGLANEELNDLIENGVIVPVDIKAPSLSFRLSHVVIATTARKLRDDFELDRHGMTLALTLMRRIDELEQELNAMRVQLGHSMLSE
jgi:chaperone modulatory protein CbpM